MGRRKKLWPTKRLSVTVRADKLDALDVMADVIGKSRQELVSELIDFAVSHTALFDGSERLKVVDTTKTPDTPPTPKISSADFDRMISAVKALK